MTTFLDGRPFKSIREVGAHVKTECEESAKLKDKKAEEAKKGEPP